MGLPGTTLDTWYNEFNKPYEWDILIRAYEWYLLPEAESFSLEYRKKHNIQTAKKWFNKEDYTIPSEVVVGGDTFSRDDYKQIMTAYALYIFFVQSGVYKKSIADLKIPFGDFLRKFYNECYPNLKEASNESFLHYETHVTNFVSNDVNEVLHNIRWKNEQGPEILHFVYFIVEFFKHYEILGPIVEQWLIDIGADPKTVKSDSELIYSEKRMNTVKQRFLTKIKYDLYKNEQEFLDDVLRSSQYTYGKLLTTERTLGISLWKIK
jgi:hypothetical protein